MNTKTNVNEIWRIINFTNGDYSVSNLGRVKSNGYYTKNPKSIRYVTPIIKKLGNHNAGYLNVSIYSKSYLVHRLIAEAFLPNHNNLEFVNHIDGNKHNNCIENLQWVTRQENEKHAFSTGLKNSTGENNTMAKLTKEQVYFIKYKEKRGIGIATTLEYKYGVDRITIQRIWNNKVWKHI